MQKTALIIAGSPRKGGNSDILCDQFIKGAIEAGYATDKIYLQDQKMGFCMACYGCQKNGVCVQKDDVAAILEKMAGADIIVLATPVYYYSMTGQLKTLIDRTLPRYRINKISDKDFYFIVTAAEEQHTMERTVEGLRGFIECLPDAKLKGVVYGAGVYEKGAVKTKPFMEEAYQMGRAS
ncbi:MAG: flavodoxin family protein [Clostridia bacterium]|jgi:multimeric flavodoxin WrbA|nr:flavodoxin family protein [Clostridia bacterium]